MNSGNASVASSTAAALLAHAQSKGVSVWLENGELRYRSRRGVLDTAEVAALKAVKNEILALLTPAQERGPAVPVLRTKDRTGPLSFSQLAHWRLYQLQERPSMRQVTSATRIAGRLDVRALRTSLAYMLERHDALRTRIVVRDGTPMQEVAHALSCELELIDISARSALSKNELIQHLIHEIILQPVRPSLDGLLAVRLVKLSDEEHVLILAMEHLISDGFSLGILLRDLLNAYSQAEAGGVCSLPAVPTQFVDYALRQRRELVPWLQQHVTYWREHLLDAPRISFPDSGALQTTSGRGSVPVRIGQASRAELSEWCRRARTTPVMAVLSAYTALVLRWCNASEMVVQYVTDGRTSPDIEHTIGYFASVVYLRVCMQDGDTFLDVLRHNTAEYCRATEHLDEFYLAAQEPAPACTKNTMFNWRPGSASVSRSLTTEPTLDCSPVHFAYPGPVSCEIDREPFVLLSDGSNGVCGEVYFSLNRFSIPQMERFARNFHLFVSVLLKQPHTRIGTIPLH